MDDRTQKYVQALRAHPSPYNSVTNEVDYDAPRLKEPLKGPCGGLLRASIECYTNSDAQIRGLDCIDSFLALQECCKRNLGTCHPRIEAEEE